MAIVAVAVMTGGCSSKDDVQQDGCVPIRLSATVESSKAGHTRAGTTGSTTQDTELLDGQTVAAYIKEKGGDWLANPLACTVSGTDGDLTYSGNYNYPMDGTPVTIYAVHPSSATSGDPFTVSSDQTDADNYAASDLCYSKTADYNRQETAQTLIFSHVLSKIIVNVDVSGLGITPAPAVTNLMLWAKTQTTMTYPTGSNPDYSLSEASTPGYIAMNVGGAAIIPPQTTTAAGDVRITFDVAGIGPISYDFPANTQFESNKEYTFTVNVGTTITVTSSINPWGGSATTAEHSYTGSVTPIQVDICLLYTSPVAEYNVDYTPASGTAWDNGAGTFSFATSYDEGYFFSWNDAMKYFTTTANSSAATPSSISGYSTGTGSVLSGWHLPSLNEIFSILPVDNVQLQSYDGSGTGTYKSTFITPVFGYNSSTKAGISESSYFKMISRDEIHAIRFLGTDHCSAWKYEMLTENGGAASSSNMGYLRVSATLIDKIDNNATAASDWYNANWNDVIFSNDYAFGAVQRIIYSVGNRNTNGNSAEDRYGEVGWYWSATEYSANVSLAWVFQVVFASPTDWLSTHWNYPKATNYYYPVRLFRDN